MRPSLFISLSLTSALAAGLGNVAVAGCSAGSPNLAVAESTPDADLEVNSFNGTVMHRKTMLMWKRCAEGLSGDACELSALNSQATFDWAGALAAANAANSALFAGYDDWRLPNKKELESISELCGYQPAINQRAFPGTPPTNFFWSSTSHLRDSTQAWMVTSWNGATGYDQKFAAHYVRLVRGGHANDPFDALRVLKSKTGHSPRFITSDFE